MFTHAGVCTSGCVCKHMHVFLSVCVCVWQRIERTALLLCSSDQTRPSPKLFMLILPARWKALPLHFLYIFPINIKHYYNEMGFSYSLSLFLCTHTHTHTHTHTLSLSASFSRTLDSSSLVFHLLFLALLSLAYLWLAWLSKQEMGMQNTADRIKRTSPVCVCVCVCVFVRLQINLFRAGGVYYVEGGGSKQQQNDWVILALRQITAADSVEGAREDELNWIEAGTIIQHVRVRERQS